MFNEYETLNLRFDCWADWATPTPRYSKIHLFYAHNSVSLCGVSKPAGETIEEGHWNEYHRCGACERIATSRQRTAERYAYFHSMGGKVTPDEFGEWFGLTRSHALHWLNTHAQRIHPNSNWFALQNPLLPWERDQPSLTAKNIRRSKSIVVYR